MKRCAEIEPLLMLHREGERTSAEQTLVDAHLGECSRCRNIAAQFSAVEESLAEARTIVAGKHAMVDITARVMGVIHEHSRGEREIKTGWKLDALLEWLVPSVAAPVVALLLLLVVQESVDYAKINATEQRLRGVGDSASLAVATRSSVTGIREAIAAAGEYATVDERKLLARSGRVIAALVGNDDSENLPLNSAIAANRFPAISSVLGQKQVDPGLRRDLSAEGVRLLNEIQQSNVKGVQ